jgi:hypothetical protein
MFPPRVGVNGYIVDRDDRGGEEKIYTRFLISVREALALGFGVDSESLAPERVEEAEARGLSVVEDGERGTELAIEFDYLSRDRGHRVDDGPFFHDCLNARIVAISEAIAA